MTGETTVESTGGATSSYYIETDTDGDGVSERVYISGNNWKDRAIDLSDQAIEFINTIDTNTNRFWNILEWDASGGLFPELDQMHVLPDGTQGAGTTIPGTSAQGEIIKISRFAKDDACYDMAYESGNYGDDGHAENDDAGCDLDLETIVDIRRQLGDYYMRQAESDDYNSNNWKLAARQFELIINLIEFVNANHSYIEPVSNFTGKRKLSGFSKNSQLRKKIADSRIKKETKTISDAFLSAWEAFKNEIKAN
tara:strand:- start:161 stop:919 length:759 start_codon:yes stop_codon:yes gene_type:complete